MAMTPRAIKVTDAAKLLSINMSDDTLKTWLRDAYRMKAQPCPFGHAVYTESGRWNYYIYPLRLRAYNDALDLGMNLKPLPEDEPQEIP